MSKLDSAEKMLHETIAKLSHEVDRLSVKIKEIPILENNNNELAQKIITWIMKLKFLNLILSN